ncbi:MAG: hypothetical protein ACP6IS_10940 [Candidatus Asgardarchaeia archaeon]
MYTIYIQGIPKEKLQEIIQLETLENIKFRKVRELGVFKADSDKLGELYLQKGFNKSIYEENGVIKKKRSSWNIGGFEAIDAEALLIFLAILVIFFIGYVIALLGAWIIGNLFTLGSYRYRRHKFILYVKPPNIENVDYNAITKTLERISREIFKQGGYVKFESTEGISEDILEKSQDLLGKYNWFNRGEKLIQASLVIAVIFEGAKFLLEHFSSYQIQITSETAWFLWRIPALIFALIGLILMVVSEIKIRRTKFSS